MSKTKTSKTEAKEKIESFFVDIKNKTPEEIKKIKRIAMRYHVRPGEKRKTFCKKCLTPYSGNEKVRIKNGKKIIECSNCGEISRWRIKD